MNDVFLAQEYANELEAEVPATLKCLERIPPELFGWKPHEKSMGMGYLTLLVAEVPLWIAHIARDPEIDFATFKHIEAKTTQEVVDHFNQNIAQAKQALQTIAEGDMDKPFHLKANGQIIFTSTKHDTLGSTLNHWVHHRGQLTVYMRLNDIAVPSIYGPSADDKVFG
jgi:uncharacterized damage-inducible protein DinB